MDESEQPAVVKYLALDGLSNQEIFVRLQKHFGSNAYSLSELEALLSSANDRPSYVHCEEGLNQGLAKAPAQELVRCNSGPGVQLVEGEVKQKTAWERFVRGMAVAKVYPMRYTLFGPSAFFHMDDSDLWYHMTARHRASGYYKSFGNISPAVAKLVRRAVKIVEKVGKSAFVVSVTIDICQLGCAITHDVRNRSKVPARTIVTCSSTAGGWLGGIGGAAFGARVGSVVGEVVGLHFGKEFRFVGEALGSIFCCVLLGVSFGIAGSSIAEKLGRKFVAAIEGTSADSEGGKN